MTNPVILHVDVTHGDQVSLENTLEGVSIIESSKIYPTKKKLVVM